MSEHAAMPEAGSFLAETQRIYDLLQPLRPEDFQVPTQFKQWTFDDIVGHLHLWNVGARLSLHSREAFQLHVQEFWTAIQGGQSRVDYTRRWLNGRCGAELLDLWRNFTASLAEDFSRAEPRARVPWIGPEMSVRSSATARLMETWAHAQAIYDLLGVVRISTDDVLHSISVLGINTHSWTFRNRGLATPPDMPYVELHAPSGARWAWGAPEARESIRGRAEEFCQVMTQTRNVADTDLDVRGSGAMLWMSLAQCFAGAPVDPPLPGTRFRIPR